MVQAERQNVMSEVELAELKIRCLLLSLHNNITLLVPNTLVAEVIDFRPVDEAAHLPDWVTGMVPWRGRSVPLISFERMIGLSPAGAQQERRYVIFNTLSGNAKIPFIAISTVAIPHLAMVDQKQLDYDSETTQKEPAILAGLRYNSESVIVPNLDAIEKMLAHLGVTAA